MSRWMALAPVAVLLLGEWSISPAMTAEHFAERAKDPVSFDFVDTRLVDVLEFLSCLMDLAVIQHPDTLGIEVTHKCKDTPLSKALTEILEPHGLEWAFMREALYVAPPAAIAAAKTAPTIDRDAPGFDGKLKRRISFHMKDVPLAAITQFLGQLEQIPVHQLGLGAHDYERKDAKVYGTKVSVRLQDAELGTFIEWVGILSGQNARIRNGKIAFGDLLPPKRRKDAETSQQPPAVAVEPVRPAEERQIKDDAPAVAPVRRQSGSHVKIPLVIGGVALVAAAAWLAVRSRRSRAA